MHKHIILTSLLFFLILSSLSGETDLWKSCYRLYSSNVNWIAGRSNTRIFETTNTGKITSDISFTSSISIGSNNLVWELISATRDGKYMSEKELKSQIWWPQGNKDNQKTQFNTIELFQESNSSKIVYKDTGKIKNIKGIECRAFNYQYSKEKDLLYSGTAWIAIKEKAPISIDFILVNRPVFISEMCTRNDYTYIDDNHWYLSEMYLEVDAKILFIQKFFKSEIYMTNALQAQPGCSLDLIN